MGDLCPAVGRIWVELLLVCREMKAVLQRIPVLRNDHLSKAGLNILDVNCSA